MLRLPICACASALLRSLGLDEFGDEDVTEANPWEGEEEEDLGEGEGEATDWVCQGAKGCPK